MAICFINVNVISAADRSAVQLAAYISRANMSHPRMQSSYCYARKAADLVGDPIVLLPDDAPAEFNDPATLWNAAELAEMTFDRQKKEYRFKKKASLAKHIILALPKELDDTERRDLALAWARQQYPGVAVMMAMHRSHDPESDNYHAHLLVSTRMVTGKGFGNKARHIDPRFASTGGKMSPYIESQDLPKRWAAFQNDFFVRRGIPLRVDETLAIGRRHLGAAVHLPKMPEDSACPLFINRKEVENKEAKALARALISNSPYLLELATERRSIFTANSVKNILKHHDIAGDEAEDILKKTFALPEMLRLYDGKTGEVTPYYTTRKVRMQETVICDLGRKLAKSKMPKTKRVKLEAAAAKIAQEMSLANEQHKAFLHALAGNRICLIRGVAGAGKSYTIKAIRKAYEAAGYECVGLAPTNTVVDAMRREEFARYATLNSEQYREQKKSPRYKSWSSKTCVIVDEAAMMDANLAEWLLKTAEETGAAVTLVGDEAQLASVSRGGSFGYLRGILGAAELKEIRRQKLDWQKAASLDFSEARIADGLKAYSDHGHIHWGKELTDTENALAAKWAKDYWQAPGVTRFVFCATNDAANRLNRKLQQIRFDDEAPLHILESDRGQIALYMNDRVQFHATDKSLGIMNGHIGSVIDIKENEITVALDGGGTTSFDPYIFTGWGLGYAGTVYRGQGKTLPQAYALYDNAIAWSARASYVAFTRHTEAFDLFVPRILAPNLDILGRQMSRMNAAGASLTYLTKEEADARFPRIPFAIFDGSPVSRKIDAASAEAASALEIHWRRVPPGRFAADFNKLDRAAAKTDMGHPLRVHLSRATTIARDRGFRPWSGEPDIHCLRDFLPHSDGLTRSAHPALAPQYGEIDIRPIVIDIEDIEAHAWMNVQRRVRRLDHRVLDAIIKQLDGVKNQIKVTSRVFADIVVAQSLARVAKLLKKLDPDGNPRPARSREEFIEIRRLIPIPREIRGRFRLCRKDKSGELVTWDIMGTETKRNAIETAASPKTQDRQMAAARDSLAPQLDKTAPSKLATGHNTTDMKRASMLKSKNCGDEIFIDDSAPREADNDIEQHILRGVTGMQDFERAKQPRCPKPTPQQAPKPAMQRVNVMPNQPQRQGIPGISSIKRVPPMKPAPQPAQQASKPVVQKMDVTPSQPQRSGMLSRPAISPVPLRKADEDNVI